MRKKHLINKLANLLVLLTLAVTVAGIVFVFCIPHVLITNEEVVIDTAGTFYPANNMQHESSVDIVAYGNHLFYREQEHLAPLSSEISETNISLKNGYIIGIYEQFLYYSVDLETNGESQYYKKVYCYSLEAGTHTYLTTVDYFSLSDVHILEDGSFYLPANSDADRYYVYDGDKLVKTVTAKFSYQYESGNYFIDGSNNEDLYCSKNGAEYNMSAEIPYGFKAMIPCQSGLLIHHYDESGGNLLYFIDGKTGKVRELFTVPAEQCNSSVNVCGNYVFISFERLQYGELSSVPYENDTLSGTYRIDLQDGSSVKINDHVYCGLYIYGNDAIYCTDEDGNIFQIDFDGKLTRVIALTPPHSLIDVLELFDKLDY